MRRVVWLLIVVSAAVGIALLMRGSHGNVAILWPPYRVDLSVNLAVLILLAVFLLLHLLFGILSGALNLPGRVREYRERRQREKALQGLRDSLLAYLEGRFGRAERLARGALSDEALAGTASLVAARSAQRMSEPERRDRWLESARAVAAVEGARRMTEAEIALEDKRPEDALAAIAEVRVRGTRHIHALRLALRAHERLGNWTEVLEHVRQLERRNAIEAPAARVSRVRALRALLDGAGDDPESVRRVLDEIPAPEREIEEVALASVRALLRAGLHEAAAKIVERALAARFDPELVALWPDLTGIAGRKRIAHAEAWLQRWGEQQPLLLALGRLCVGEELWGKAEEFLLRAERKAPDAMVRALLGQMCEQLGRPEDAARWYRESALTAFGDEGVRLAPERRAELPPPETEDEQPPVLPLPGP
ncbi:heme biosynthesis protein HemY [Burkholderiaceae bacterium FT117]|uniref:heme biosynthesis HemY N-terminal domain-containing protein n=1 Tax=Zeimonas sediminis TaxID=2944268 RepID=UPI002342CAE0|nr:heme biosynthesis HemY N-terminal domain-containing protein [Zeimonas sediminis]MCM5569375.1 heme biosynthesis protein HemY [Zeimonas sediminis]